VKANYWKIIEMAVDQGVECGLNRAFKHTDEPTREQIHAEVEREVMNIICEYFEFNDLHEG